MTSTKRKSQDQMTLFVSSTIHLKYEYQFFSKSSKKFKRCEHFQTHLTRPELFWYWHQTMTLQEKGNYRLIFMINIDAKSSIKYYQIKHNRIKIFIQYDQVEYSPEMGGPFNMCKSANVIQSNNRMNDKNTQSSQWMQKKHLKKLRNFHNKNTLKNRYRKKSFRQNNIYNNPTINIVLNGEKLKKKFL